MSEGLVYMTLMFSADRDVDTLMDELLDKADLAYDVLEANVTGISILKVWTGEGGETPAGAIVNLWDRNARRSTINVRSEEGK